MIPRVSADFSPQAFRGDLQIKYPLPPRYSRRTSFPSTFNLPRMALTSIVQLVRTARSTDNETCQLKQTMPNGSGARPLGRGQHLLSKTYVVPQTPQESVAGLRWHVVIVGTESRV